MNVKNKKYRCKRCGYTTIQSTNHYGDTWSFGHYHCCPQCPPWAKYPEYGGMTVWECIEEQIKQEEESYGRNRT